MGQHQPFSAADDNAWLSSLVDTFEQTEELSGQQCDPAALAAVMARLQSPTPARRNLSRRAEVLQLSF
ncbi:hypothetical protein RPMA_13220 [Tardiphaga alba]|uniref:Uncharacterized protein n=1 Tax=Tardiphaga alba TaxID=340268 RepID=A0ABX8A7H4_9BRAD|nr:hypothetical protein [Tardiphaga alba]QUS39691.1 hypothetical protein RPMA_13220 [Tardiphaga alba]